MSELLGANVTIMVSDMDKAILFYTETLGLKLKNRYGNHWADIEGPGMAIGLHPMGKDISIGNNLQIGFKVNDIEKSVAGLKSKGVNFLQHNDTEVKLAMFTDPDGNVMYLAQSKW